jgi:S1-C subfamily serine protease
MNRGAQMSTPPTDPHTPSGAGRELGPTPRQATSSYPSWQPGPGQPPSSYPGWQPGPEQATSTYPGWQPTWSYDQPGPQPGNPDRPVVSRRSRTLVAAAILAALVVGGGVGAGISTLVAGHTGVAPLGVARFHQNRVPNPAPAPNPGPGQVPGGVSPGDPSNGAPPQGTFPGPGPGSGSGRSNGGGGSNGSGTPNSSARSSTGATATAAQSTGIVDINTVDGYQNARAAGTGLVLTSTGEILTNNHVVDGATAITVTVITTGTTYDATVVGTSPTQDVAVLQLTGASALATATLGDSSRVSVGAAVTGVGNAGGVGGVPSAAQGSVTALDTTLTVSDQGGGNSETLHGLIVTTAPIQAGDSGGPLYDASNQVVGIDTAAEVSASSGSTSAGFAIPINAALAIAGQIDTGQASTTIHLGYPAFLGIGLAPGATSATVGTVFPGSPAARAGLVAGDTITTVDGTAVTDTTTLHRAITAHKAGDSITLTWTDAAGAPHTAATNLVAGPAD